MPPGVRQYCKELGDEEEELLVVEMKAANGAPPPAWLDRPPRAMDVPGALSDCARDLGLGGWAQRVRRHGSALHAASDPAQADQDGVVGPQGTMSHTGAGHRRCTPVRLIVRLGDRDT